MSEKSFHEIFHYDTHLLGSHERSYEGLQYYLEPSLGPATFNDSVEGHCLEFHPLEPLPDGSWYPRNPWLEEDEYDEEDEEYEDDEVGQEYEEYVDDEDEDDD